MDMFLDVMYPPIHSSKRVVKGRKESYIFLNITLFSFFTYLSKVRLQWLLSAEIYILSQLSTIPNDILLKRRFFLFLYY